MKNWVINKFGGTSVASAERYKNVANILSSTSEKDVGKFTVVSAMGGVTNRLLALINKAKVADLSYDHDLSSILDTHKETIALLLDEKDTPLSRILEADVDDISDLLRAIVLTKSPTREITELISGFGELWSAQILTQYLQSLGSSYVFLDARQVLEISNKNDLAIVSWEKSSEKLKQFIQSLPAGTQIVATGFIAATADGVPTTLGRDGSDYSASIFGSLLDAKSITIWTDVDGVMSANPRQVPEAKFLESLSYDEAMELSYFGAKVVHPKTMAPAVGKDIPIIIRNSFNLASPGTIIHSRNISKNTYDIKGFATIENMALVNVEGSNMLGVPGIAQRLFGALREADVSVVLISQASSEHSICFSVPEDQAETAKLAVEETFFAERHHGYIQNVSIQKSCAILAAVGDDMAGIPGVAARFFDGLAKARVNVRAIAQGSSERNISVVIDQVDALKGIRAVHSRFYLSKQTLSVGLIGTGVVGSVLLRQLSEHRQKLKQDFDIDIRVRGIATSKKMLINDVDIELTNFGDALTEGIDCDLEVFVNKIQTDTIPHSVIIDCTASGDVAGNYLEWLNRGIHIITPNKKANSSSMEVYEKLRAATQRIGSHYLYETTVGAGLPILQSARELVQTGDSLLSFEGVFSGTLSYLFNLYDGEKKFSQLVLEARELGFTEPDPRDDLRGIDVARKVVILGREFGLDISMEDVEVISLVPPDLDVLDLDAFLANMEAMDDQMQAMFELAKEKAQVLRYVGTIDTDGKATVRLGSYPDTHAFARIQKTDNIVLFRTQRYADNPLIIQGPGAGPDVTAGGVFADLLRLSSNLGASR